MPFGLEKIPFVVGLGCAQREQQADNNPLMIMKLKTTRILLPLALLSLLSWGCSEQQQDRTGDAYEDTKEAVQETADKAGDAIANAWDQVSGFSADRRDEFITTMQDAYSDLQSGVENLQERSEEISDQAVNQFDEASAAFQHQMDRAGDASADAWEASKDGVNEAWDNLVEAYENMQSEDPDS